MASDLTVVAIGGHSLLDPEMPSTVNNQFSVTSRAMEPVADLIQAGHRVVLTHGNGPQVGWLQLRSELARNVIHEVPLDSLVADTQGSLGYMIQCSLREDLRTRGVEQPVISVVTAVEVDPEDRAFDEPTKPIGSFYDRETAERLAAERGWRMVDDSHRGYRRVVASPPPQKILQLGVIRTLVDAGVTVICCGGGGIPVYRGDDGHLHGVEAVIDKDRASAVLAVDLGAKRLIITTGVDAVYRDFLTDHKQALPELTRAEASALEAEGQFPPGSMRPKMDAALYFLNRGGAEVFICRPESLPDALARRCGTRIRP
jgi:carbamate kinase